MPVRPTITILLAATISALGSLYAQCTANSSSNITTGQYNGYRTSANESETILTPANVSASQFGYLYSLPVDKAPVFAQPLVVHNLTINSVAYCTVVFVATMDNYVYAFNGDAAPTEAEPYIWKSAQFGTPAPYPNYLGFTTAGILDTPAIDVRNQVLYFVSLAVEGTGTAGWVYRLHAISIATGLEFFPANQTSPGGLIISGSVAGTGDDSVNGVVPFVASEQRSRTALLDVGGTIYVTFGFGNPSNGQEFTATYHGWEFAFKSCLSGSTTCATDPPCFHGSTCGLHQVSILNTTPDSHAGGIWMSGRGPAYDGAGNVFVATGNGCDRGSNPALCPPEGFSESVLNLTNLDNYVPPSPVVTAFDYNDEDLGTGGVFLVPPVAPATASSYLVAGAKTGGVTVLKTTNLAQQTGNPYQTFQATGVTSQCPSNLPAYDQPPLGSEGNPASCDEYHHPAYWSKGSSGYLYIWGFLDILRAYAFNTTNAEQFNPTPVAEFTPAANPGNGGILAISSDGPQNAILWAVTGTAALNKGVLSAFKLWSGETGTPSLTRLWDSSPSGANYFSVQRFTVPVVSNGKVFVTTPSTDLNGNTQILVYGLCSDVNTGCQEPLFTSQYMLR